jgi:prepilin-type N-terminal cleavage/methylation domain-containing protein
MRRRLDRVRAEEAGMTLIEILVSLTIGLIVLMAGFRLLDRSVAVSHEVADRQEAVQRGRQAMELMTRQLRSQVCLGENAEPITYGDPYTVTFYADLGDGSTNVERRTLAYQAPAGEPARLVEQVEPGVGTYPDLTFDPESAGVRVLIDGVEPVLAGEAEQPVFRYYAFDEGNPTGDLVELPTPLTADDASRTVMVQIAFVTLPDRVAPRDRDATTLQDNVYVRIADPTRPLEGPRCI